MNRRQDRRSSQSKLARAVVAMKTEADACEEELRALPRWRFGRRAELEETVEDLRGQERELLVALGGRPRSEAH
jgi:hypothetical protein